MKAERDSLRNAATAGDGEWAKEHIEAEIHVDKIHTVNMGLLGNSDHQIYGGSDTLRAI